MQYKRLAAAALFTLPLAATAQTANVQLYGILDAGVSVQNTGNPGEGHTTQVGSGNQSTSRFGFKGTEDLGTGLKAIFNLEAGFNVDDGKSDADTGKGLFQRRAVVGLEGDFGTVTIGREYSPIAQIAKESDLSGQGFWGTNLAAFNNSAAHLTRRLANSVNWKSASYNGLDVLVAYSAGEKTGNVPSGDLKSAGIEYKNGPLYLGLGYAATKRVASGDDKEIAFGAAYTFEGVEFKGDWLVADTEGVAVGKFKVIDVGVAKAFGPHKVYATVQQQKYERNDAKANVFAIAYAYTLSKRTNLYATIATARNNDKATFGIYSSSNTLAPSATALGADPKVFTTGIRHSF
jgi:predicted porin